LFAAVDNVFDKNPPIAAGSGFGGNANGGANPVFFDTLGRAFCVGLRATF
jgi:outer membrane receptor protein involved in Fe transport